MKVNDELIDKLARLSMLEFNAAEKEEIKIGLEEMIRFIDKLQEVDTAGVEPLLHISPAQNILRNDTPQAMLTQAEALKNAPAHNGKYFLVPKVINKEPS